MRARPAVVLVGFASAVAAVVALAATPRPATALARVVGTVRTTLRPLAGVHVGLPTVGAWSTTDSTGRFVLVQVPSGVHALELAAVGYAPVHNAIVVSDLEDRSGSEVDAGPFLLAPLRPDEMPIGFNTASDSAASAARTRTPELAALDSLAPSSPLLANVGFHRTAEEAARWPAPAELRPASSGPHTTGEAFADLLRRVAVADSITLATGGMGAPGFETWRQWGDRFALYAGDSTRALEPRLAADSALVLRAVAYARTRAALAAGATVTGYRLATDARGALARASRADRGEGATFLRFLGGEVDRVFVPGSSPPKPPPPPKKKKRSGRKR